MSPGKLDLTEEETLQLYGQVCRLEERLLQLEDSLPLRLEEKYMDNQDFLILMNLDKRRLQRWRQERAVPFSPVGRKFYYHVREISRLLERGVIRKGKPCCGKK